MSCPPGDVAGRTEQQYEKAEYNRVRKAKTGKPKHNKNIFGAASAVCGRGSIVGRGSTYDVVGLVPCYISFVLCQPHIARGTTYSCLCRSFVTAELESQESARTLGMYAGCVCSSHQTKISTRLHPAHPVSVPPTEIQALWFTKLRHRDNSILT